MMRYTILFVCMLVTSFLPNSVWSEPTSFESIIESLEETLAGEPPALYAQLHALRAQISHLLDGTIDMQREKIIHYLLTMLSNRYLDTLRESEEFEDYIAIQKSLKNLCAYPQFHYAILVGLLEAIAASLNTYSLYPSTERKKTARRVGTLLREAASLLSEEQYQRVHSDTHTLYTHLQKTIVENAIEESKLNAPSWYSSVDWGTNLFNLLRIALAAGTILGTFIAAQRVMHAPQEAREQLIRILHLLLPIIPTIINLILNPGDTSRPDTSTPIPTQPMPRRRNPYRVYRGGTETRGNNQHHQGQHAKQPSRLHTEVTAQGIRYNFVIFEW